MSLTDKWDVEKLDYGNGWIVMDKEGYTICETLATKPIRDLISNAPNLYKTLLSIRDIASSKPENIPASLLVFWRSDRLNEIVYTVDRALAEMEEEI
jgi:hypothetical protein